MNNNLPSCSEEMRNWVYELAAVLISVDSLSDACRLSLIILERLVSFRKRSFQAKPGLRAGSADIPNQFGKKGGRDEDPEGVPESKLVRHCTK